MLRKFIAAALISLLATQAAAAFFHRAAVASFPAVGNAQINLGGTGILTNAQVFTNLWDSSSYGLFSGAIPDYINSDGFPIASIAVGSIAGAISNGGAPLISTGPYTWGWDAGASCFSIAFTSQGANVVPSSNVNSTFSNGAGTGHFTVTGDCVHAGSIQFSWTNTSGTVVWSFLNTVAYSSNTSGRMWMCRNSNVGWSGLDDCTAYQSGIRWTKEFVNMLTELKPQTLRPMGITMAGPGQTSINTTWAYRGNATKFSLSAAGGWPMTARSGGGPSLGNATGSNGQYTAAPATDTSLSGWVNGEILLTTVVNGSGGLQVAGVASGAGGNCAVTVSTAALTGTTNGTTLVTTASTTSVYNGMPITAADIPAGAFVSSFVANTSITLNIAATGSNTNESITGGGVAGITVGQPISFFNVGGTTELNVNETTVTAVNSGTNVVTVNIPFVHAWTSGGNIAYQTLSISGKSGGAKLIVSTNGQPIGTETVNNAITSGPTNFYYSAVSDHVGYSTSGVTQSVPPEALIQLANLANANLWMNYGEYATDDYITQLGTLVKTTLNPNLKGYFELCNEIWNPSWQCSSQSNNLGVGAGLFTNSTTSYLPYQALRTLQAGKLLQAVFTGGDRARLKNLYMIQGGSGLGNFSIESEMNGSVLAILGLGYDSFPNRPIDYTDVIGYAPYIGAPGLADGNPDTGQTPTILDLPYLQTVGDNYIAGNTTAAYNQISSLFADGQVNPQTVTASGTTFTLNSHGFVSGNLVEFGVTGGTTYSGLNTQSLYSIDSTTTNTFTVKLVSNGSTAGSDTNAGTAGSGITTVGKVESSALGLFGLSQVYYVKYQFMATNGFSPAPVVNPMPVDWYEGSLEISPPTAAHATAIGLVTPSTPATTTGTTHGTGSTVVDGLTSVAGIYPGMVVSATDITGGQLVSTVNSGCPTTCTGNYVVMNGNANGTTSNESVTFTGTATLANSTIQAAITGWKNSSQAKATQELYYNVFKGTVSGYITSGAMPNSDAPANLALMSVNPLDPWTLVPNAMPATPAPFQTFCGVQTFNGGSGFGC